MTQYVKSEFSTELALSILNEIHYQRYNYYSFLGKCDPWDNADTVPVNPQTNSSADYRKIRNNIVYMKRITPNDISMVIRRVQWSESFPKIFDQWDDTLEMQHKDFYCVTDTWNVYKCLNNNYNTVSSVKPTDTGNVPVMLADGYIWKYLYTIPSFKITKFVTSTYFPVQLALSDSFYNKGSVENIIIVNPGYGYTDNLLTTLTVSSPEAGGTYAVLVPSISTEDLYDVTGTILLRHAGAITNVTIVDPGSNYLTPPTITINDVNGLGQAIYGAGEAKLTAIIFEGSVVNVTIEDPGKGYSVDTDSYITVSGDGKDAKFTPMIFDGKLVDVVTENVGTGYNIMQLQLNGAGSDAQMMPMLGVSDYTSTQATIEQTAINKAGSIYLAIVTDGGINYTQSNDVVATGDGTGFAATAVVIDGTVQKINITNFGQDYTYIDIRVVDRITYSDTAVVRAVIPPTGGHGRHAINELYSNTVVVNSFIQKDVLLNKFNQDYRQLGIIKNPLNKITSTTFRDPIANMCFEVILDDSAGLLTEFVGADEEDILAINDSRFRVISKVVNNVLLLQLDNKYTQPLGDLICERTGDVYKSIQLVTVPIVDRFSGKLLYVSDENPFTFVDNQGLNIKTFLEF